MLNCLIHKYTHTAERWDMAIQYFSKAGEQALNNFANREAVNFFSECLELQKKKLGIVLNNQKNISS